MVHAHRGTFPSRGRPISSVEELSGVIDHLWFFLCTGHTHELMAGQER